MFDLLIVLGLTDDENPGSKKVYADEVGLF